MPKIIAPPMKKYSLCFFLIVLIFNGNLLKAQNNYFPPKGDWEEKQPQELGINTSVLQKAIEFAVQEESTADKNLKIAHYQSAFGREPLGYPVGPMRDRGEAAGLIIHKGFIVGKWGDPHRVDLTFSVAKSILSTTVGLAYDKGLIKSEKDLVYPYMAPIIPYDP